MNNIELFWKHKHLYKQKDELKRFAREYYTEDFIQSYDKWKASVSRINQSIKMDLEELDFPMQFYSEMSFDRFCTDVNNSIENWIENHGDILTTDLATIIEKILTDFTIELMTKAEDHLSSVSSLLQSIKKIKIS